MQARQVKSSRLHVQGGKTALTRCIEECFACAQTCISCANACLGEDMAQQLAPCIRLGLDCADACVATGAIASRRAGSDEQLIRSMLQACNVACRLCAEECERHAGRHEHCRVCAESCRRCEQACEEAARSMA